METDSATLPIFVRRELARLKKFDPIVDDTIVFNEHDDGQASISFNLTTDLLLENVECSILDSEPIRLLYPNISAIGKIAPEVQSQRLDFPRDLVHLFQSTSGEPASFCLARAGLQSIYDVSGIDGVILRLINWLNDAKTETLYEDGWEPIPINNWSIEVIGLFDFEYLQNYAFKHPDGGYRYICVPITHLGEERIFLDVSEKIVNTSNTSTINYASRKMKTHHSNMINVHPHEIPYTAATAIPAIFLWPEKDKVTTVPSFNTWNDINSFLDGLKDLGLYNSFFDSIPFFVSCFSKDSSHWSRLDHDGKSGHALVVIVGLWRPTQIDSTIIGLAEENGPRSLELRALYLKSSHTMTNGKFNKTKISNILDFVPNDSRVLEAVSGESPLCATIFLGGGALGSAYINYALRGGTENLAVFDSDILQSHNLARHQGTSSYLGLRKTEVAKLMAHQRSSSAKVKRYNENIENLDDDSLVEHFKGFNQIIDTTANPLVRRRLSALRSINLPILRSEIFHKGQLGISFITKLGANQNLNCLYFQLLARAMENKFIQSWLAYEDSRTYLDEELLVGHSCSSRSIKLPAYKIEAHAASMFAFGKENLQSFEQPLILINRIDSIGLPLGVEIITPSPLSVFFDARTNGWRILVEQKVLDQIHSWRKKALPNETGGYLIGAMDDWAKEIYIVSVSSEPPGSKASPSSLSLAKWGQTEFEKAFMRRTSNRLLPIGTWHSHPFSSAELSETDWKTIQACKDENTQQGIPTIAAISGVSEDAFFVV